jgi:hypothetical protein
MRSLRNFYSIIPSVPGSTKCSVPLRFLGENAEWISCSSYAYLYVFHIVLYDFMWIVYGGGGDDL